MICFSNPGEIDIEAVTVLGASIKPGASPIGFFGTGLKYAIAVLLREKQSIEIWSGPRCYRFELRARTIRGEIFEIIHMIGPEDEDRSLGFTTAFGRNWTLENAYRELWSNAKDEGGYAWKWNSELLELDGPINVTQEPEEGWTLIKISGEAFTSIHANRFEFLLAPSRIKISENTTLEVYAGRSSRVFYKGISAFTLEKPSIFTYNITKTMQLTEDRTLASGDFWVGELVGDWARLHAPEELLRDVLTAPKNSREGMIYFSSLYVAGETFRKVVKKEIELGNEVNATASALVFAADKNMKLEYVSVEISEAERVELDSALERIRDWGFDYEQWQYKIQVVESCGADIIARVNGKDTCVLTRRAIADVDLLEHALIEEFVHLRDQVNDNSREMQNSLFREIVRMGRKISEITVLLEINDEIPF